MRLDRKLNLVIPIDRDDGTTLYTFSSPLRREVWEQYHMVISKTFTRIYAENLSFMGGPRNAALMLKDMAKNTARPDRSGDWWEGQDGVERGLRPEMRRLTTVMVPRAEGGGWEQVQYDDAIARDMLTEDEASEVEGAVAFFTVNSAMHKAAALKGIMAAAAGMWGMQVTSSPFSEWRNSLTTSTADDDITQKVIPSSIPS